MFCASNHSAAENASSKERHFVMRGEDKRAVSPHTILMHHSHNYMRCWDFLPQVPRKRHFNLPDIKGVDKHAPLRGTWSANAESSPRFGRPDGFSQCMLKLLELSDLPMTLFKALQTMMRCLSYRPRFLQWCFLNTISAQHLSLPYKSAACWVVFGTWFYNI